MLRDLRFAIRTLARTPAFSLAAGAILALGIGINSTLFSFGSAVLRRPLPGIAAPERLAWVTTIRRDRPRPMGLSYPDYLDYRSASFDEFADMLAFHTAPFSLGSGGDPERIQGQVVSGSFFPTLGTVAVAGRLLGPDDDVRGAPRAVVVVSHRLWRQRFASAPDPLQQTVVLNGRTFSIVGVAAEGFIGPALDEPADLWIPCAAWPLVRTSERSLLDARGSSEFAVMGRIRPGVSAKQAQASLAGTAVRLHSQLPSTNGDISVVVGALGSPVPPSGRAEMIPMAALLFVITGVVLLIACANVANLLLARGAARTQEIGIREALGASRGRLVRQLFAESTVLAAVGATAGLLFALWAEDLISAAIGDAVPGLHAAVDWAVLGFTIATSCLTLLVFGLLPAVLTTRRAILPTLRTAAEAGGRSRVQGMFVVAQLALSMMLVMAAGLSLRAVQKGAAIDLGFRPDHLLAASYDLALQNYPNVRRNAFRRAMLAEVRALPGVTSATIANMAPLDGRMVGRSAKAADALDEPSMVFANAVESDYFATLGIRVAGRGFDERDSAGAPDVAIVNVTLRQRLWRDTNAIGRQLDLDGHVYEVVGVAQDAKYDEPTEGPTPFVYLPLAQAAQLDRETLLVRVAGAPMMLSPAVREIIRRLDPALPVFDVRPFDSVLHDRAEKQRVVSGIFSGFSVLALALAAAGVYAVMAYTVARRSREIGVRLALGATRGQVTASILREGARLAVTGAGLGAALALPLSRVLGPLVFGIQISDLLSFAAACALLVTVAVAAAFVPATWAGRLNPIVALRSE